MNWISKYFFLKEKVFAKKDEVDILIEIINFL
jgi:hypothetical protein